MQKAFEYVEMEVFLQQSIEMANHTKMLAIAQGFYKQANEMTAMIGAYKLVQAKLQEISTRGEEIRPLAPK